MITFRVGSWRDDLPRLRNLFQEFWEEGGESDRPLQVDEAAYQALEQLQRLHVVVAETQGQLVGVGLFFVSPHLHYKNDLMAVTDILYIRPSHRRGFTGIQLFAFLESSLKARGVTKIFFAHRVSLDLSPILRRRGWIETERVYSKRV